jgi:hypothetical protein
MLSLVWIFLFFNSQESGVYSFGYNKRKDEKKGDDPSTPKIMFSSKILKIVCGESHAIILRKK